MKKAFSVLVALVGFAPSVACGTGEEDLLLLEQSPSVQQLQRTPPLTSSPWNWMQDLDDDVKLSALSIPGTHDSGARYETFGGTAKCQNLTIAEQLQAGVRFLDIRCRHVGNGFAIHHGSVYQKLNFDDVLSACVSFLDSRPSETILMSVKEEYDPSDNSRSFEETFRAYVQKDPNRWLLSDSIPTLGEARGKIVLLRRFGANSPPIGIPAGNWADNTTFSSGVLRVQDSYKVSDNNAKWNSIAALFAEALNGPQDTLFINFTSGYKPRLFGIPSITSVSDNINPRLLETFRASSHGRYGILAMDFVDTYRSSLVAKTNFDDSGAGVLFFQDADFGGPVSQMLPKGRYTLSQLSALGVPNDWASSVKIPMGWRVTVYEHDQFAGSSWTLVSGAAGAQSNFLEVAGLNDAMSSCVID